MSISSLAPRVRRALLYLQGFDKRKIAKASAHPTLDCACLDMEDGVALSKKEDARKGIIEALTHVDFGRTERLVRINGFETGNLARRDLDAVIASRVLPDGIVIPKVESATDVLTVSQELDALGDIAQRVRIICMIESPKALLNMNAICSASPERMDAVIFGGDDYASSVGATRTKSGEELDFARNYMLLHAAAYGVSCIDVVQIDFRNDTQLREESERSFREGYSGKQIIHPAQIDPVQEAYSPTFEAIAHARAVVQAHVKHQEKGEGAFEFEGKMIDAPTVKQFELLLAKARLMGLYNDE
jgi:citrate lyase subunit beta-like protein